ncbi:hypothetical protein N0V82_005118 [Gnomoniopsis sp. IMI 355080]|nr:hypothetical protein N0V82_005118 [Gnomoniopsis sp. IMI 355080]
MDAELRRIEESKDDNDKRSAIFAVFNESLRNSAPNSAAKAASIVDGVLRVRASIEDTALEKEDFNWQFWQLLVEFAEAAPPDHLWQQVLLEVVDDLRSRARQNGDVDLIKGSLDDLTTIIIDTWAGEPTGGYKGGDMLSEEEEEDLTRWMHLNSFIARLTNTIPQRELRWTNMCVYQVRKPLEQSLEEVDSKVVDCWLWICTEWLLHAARTLHKFVCCADEDKVGPRPRDRISPTYSTGPLAKDLPDQSAERWDFWITRLKAMSGRSEELDQRLAEVTHSMENMRTVS